MGPASKDLQSLTVVNLFRRHKSNASVLVFCIVPGEKGTAEISGILD
jgi:hypothetical protein